MSAGNNSLPAANDSLWWWLSGLPGLLMLPGKLFTNQTKEVLLQLAGLLYKK
jgi:hypothetical protein